MNTRQTSRLAATLLILLALSCAGNIEPTRQIDDAILSANVREALDAEPSLRGLDITVSTNGGRVRLIGTVSSSFQKQRAEQIAAGVDGVTAVQNLLEIR